MVPGTWYQWLWTWLLLQTNPDHQRRWKWNQAKEYEGCVYHEDQINICGSNKYIWVSTYFVFLLTFNALNSTSWLKLFFFHFVAATYHPIHGCAVNCLVFLWHGQIQFCPVEWGAKMVPLVSYWEYPEGNITLPKTGIPQVLAWWKESCNTHLTRQRVDIIMFQLVLRPEFRVLLERLPDQVWLAGPILWRPWGPWAHRHPVC